jgi:hypothetical protein
MHRLRWHSTGLGVLAGIVWLNGASATAQTGAAGKATADKTEQLKSAKAVPVDELPAKFRDGVRLCLDKPILFTRGPAEAFASRPDLYYWFLDHPDRAVIAWQRLGAKCVGINERGPGRFGWSDDQGSDLVWETVQRTPNLRVWYAEGKVRPAPLLPLVPVKAVVILRHVESQNAHGDTILHHQADMFLHTDSGAAALATKLLGATAPKFAEQCLGQLQLFFSGLSWYLTKHPERTEKLLTGNLMPTATIGPRR